MKSKQKLTHYILAVVLAWFLLSAMLLYLIYIALQNDCVFKANSKVFLTMVQKDRPKRPCPEKRYFFSNEEVNWFTAFEKCKSLGLQLITISSKAEYDHLQEKVQKKGYDHWLSLTDLAKEGSFVWMSTGKASNLTEEATDLTGEAKTFRVWENKQPDNYNGEEHCVVHRFKKFPAWSDANCMDKNRYICETPQVTCNH